MSKEIDISTTCLAKAEEHRKVLDTLKKNHLKSLDKMAQQIHQEVFAGD